jgi:tRNA nucleotidyltransferase/poly(A) polymerase
MLDDLDFAKHFIIPNSQYSPIPKIEKALTPEPRFCCEVDFSLPPEVSHLCNLFDQYGYNLWGVGGVARDLVLGKTPKDIDLITDASPKIITQILDKHGLKRISIGNQESFGIFTVKGHDQELYEIATLRNDRNEPTTDLIEDLKRRDFQMNGLVLSLTPSRNDDLFRVLDYIGVLPDLHDGTLSELRTIQTPEITFAQDRSRILRAISQSCRFNLNLSEDIKDSLLTDNRLTVVDADGKRLDGMSIPQIREQFLLGLQKAPYVYEYLNRLKTHRLLEQIFPGIEVNFESLKNLNPTQRPQPATLLAIILKPTQDLEKALSKLTYTTQEKGHIKFLHSLQNFQPNEAPELKREYTRILRSKDGANQSGVAEIRLYFELIEFDDNHLSEAFCKYIEVPFIQGDEAMKQFLVEKGTLQKDEGITDHIKSSFGKQYGLEYRRYLERVEVEGFKKFLT